jgi:hypothetical protein
LKCRWLNVASRHAIGAIAMSHKKSSSRLLVGLSAATGAFGVAATMLAAAPTARADDFTDIISNVDTELAFGQIAFENISLAFASDDPAMVLPLFLDGVDDDFLNVPTVIFVGTVEALTNEPVSAFNYFYDFAPLPIAITLTQAEAAFSNGESELTAAAMDLANSDFGGAALLGAFGLDNILVTPLEDLLLGAASVLGF